MSLRSSTASQKLTFKTQPCFRSRSTVPYNPKISCMIPSLSKLITTTYSSSSRYSRYHKFRRMQGWSAHTHKVKFKQKTKNLNNFYKLFKRSPSQHNQNKLSNLSKNLKKTIVTKFLNCNSKLTSLNDN